MSNPAAIFQTAFGFCSAKVLLTAVEFDLFTILDQQQLTAEELGERLQLHPRGTFDFFDALVAMGFLERRGEGPTATYANTDTTATFLVASSPRYVGGLIRMLNARLFRFWDDLPEALRTGQPQTEVKHSQKPIFETLYANQPQLEQFVGAMRGASYGNFEAFAAGFDFGPFQTLCDVGGASGLLSILVAQHHPHMRCVSFDLPAVAPIADRHIAEAGLTDRVTTRQGDFFVDPLPQADLITMGMVLHDWNLERKLHLMRSAYASLPSGGALVAIENLIDDERRSNLFGLLMSLNMLIETGDGFDFTFADFCGWGRQVGFRRFAVLPLAGPCSAAIAYKD